MKDNIDGKSLAWLYRVAQRCKDANDNQRSIDEVERNSWAGKGICAAVKEIDDSVTLREAAYPS